MEAIKVVLPSGTSYKEKIYIRLNKEENKVFLKENYNEIIRCINTKDYISFNELKKRCAADIKKSDLLYLKYKDIIDLKTELKKNVSIKQKCVYKLLNVNDCNEFINSNKKETKQVQVLKKIIENNDELTISELMKKYDCSRSVLTGLEKKAL